MPDRRKAKAKMAPRPSTTPDRKTPSVTAEAIKQAVISKEASLTGIPPELRNKIYYLVINNITEVKIRDDKVDDPPLARTCKQLRKDFLPVFHGNELIGVETIKADIENVHFGPLCKVVARTTCTAVQILVNMVIDNEFNVGYSGDDTEQWCELMNDKEDSVNLWDCMYHVILDNVGVATRDFPMHEISGKLGVHGEMDHVAPLFDRVVGTLLDYDM